MNDHVFDLWTNAILSVPGSKLILKCKAFASDSIKEELLEKLEKKGIARDRVKLMGHKSEVKEHLLLYNEIDIALDTFPYAGTTTTVESLFMGVPVVTLRGANNHAHNVGVSLLTSVGKLVSHLISDSTTQFVENVVKLASDVPQLTNIRNNLRSELLASRLCNKELFINNTVQLYRQFWKNYCDSLGKSS